MRKIKIFITIILLYEFAMLTILHLGGYCLSIFNYGFCTDSFRYFLMCIALPVSLALFAWWVPEMSRIFCKKCECAQNTQTDTPNDTFSRSNMERLVAAIIIFGVQRILEKHPGIKENLKNLAGFIKSEKK